ncbi:MAG TPA: peptidase M48 Ste24p, partial [Erythrobacter sp.]|nr:peptidase M48 Ste24p [Erythrobacter sp.]
AFNDMFASMQRIDSQTAANVIPRVVDVVTVGSGDTVASLARRMAYSDNQIDRFRVLNGLTSNEGLSVGQKVKIV